MRRVTWDEGWVRGVPSTPLERFSVYTGVVRGLTWDTTKRHKKVRGAPHLGTGTGLRRVGVEDERCKCPGVLRGRGLQTFREESKKYSPFEDGQESLEVNLN